MFFNICQHGHIFPRHQNQVAIVSEFNVSERPWAYRPACARASGRAAAKGGAAGRRKGLSRLVIRPSYIGRRFQSIDFTGNMGCRNRQGRGKNYLLDGECRRIDADAGMECSKISFALTPQPIEIRKRERRQILNRSSGLPATVSPDSWSTSSLAKLIPAMLITPLPAVSPIASRTASNALFSTKIAGIAPVFEGVRPHTRVCYCRCASPCRTWCDRCIGRTLGAHIRFAREGTWPDLPTGLQNGAIRERPRSAMSGCVGQRRLSRVSRDLTRIVGSALRTQLILVPG